MIIHDIKEGDTITIRKLPLAVSIYPAVTYRVVRRHTGPNGEVVIDQLTELAHIEPYVPTIHVGSDDE